MKLLLGPTIVWMNVNANRDPKNPQNIPFNGDKTYKMLGYDDHPDSFPNEGMHKLSTECSDLKPFVQTEADLRAWNAFLAECQTTKGGTGGREHIAQWLAGKKDGSKVYGPKANTICKQWFDTVKKRMDLTKVVSNLQETYSCRIWEVYETKCVDFPPKRAVSIVMMSVCDAYR